MKKKLVLSAMLMTVVAAGLVGGAIAAFTDIEYADTSFQAGTLDLKTDNVDGVSQTLYATTMKPGQSVGPATIALRNIGSIAGSALDITVSYTESDAGTNPVNKSADQTAAVLRVDALEYGGVSILASVADLNANGYIDVQDLKNANLSGLPGIATGAGRDFTVQLTLNTTDNDFQGDGVDLDFTFTLQQ